MNITEQIIFDQKHIWHPYTSATKPLPAYHVKSAKGAKIHLSDGRILIDGMSSWWCAIHGYNNKVLNKAAKMQLGKMSHVMFGGITHEPAVLLAKKLKEITPENLTRVFFCDSGSVAVEVAMKMAIQYWYSKGKLNKTKFLSLKKAYHGDTWNAMSVCDPVTGMHSIFKGSLSKQLFTAEPASGFGQKLNNADKKNLFDAISKNHKKIAALIVEPIVQGAGGMRFYSADYLDYARELCNEFGILLIFDEIATGFGRTGKMFACEHTSISPDIMCLGKAITGGYMSFAATLCSEEIANTISNSEPGVFMHGPTFMGNPLACSIALANIALLESWNWKEKISQIEKQLTNELSGLKSHQDVKDVRTLGAIGVVEMKKQVNVAVAQKNFINKNAWIRPFSKLIYLMPPFIISKKELHVLTNAITNTIEKGGVY